VSEMIGTVECPHCQKKFPIRVRMWEEHPKSGKGFQLAIEPLILSLPADRKLDEFL